MASRSLSKALQHVRHLLGGASGAAETDSQLLTRFVAHQDESAFRLLLERYGPMVMGVCRRLLGDAHDADDAFQATFLVLVRKADSIRDQDLLGNWLYGVALRVARRARLQASRRGPQSAEMPDMAISGTQAEADRGEVRQVLDEELSRLPRKYRVPMVLCYLEGKTNEATARSLHCPPGTVKTRLAKGRELLRAQLERRGLALTSVALAAVLAPEAVNAAVASSLAEATLAAAQATAGGAGVVSASVTGLAEGALREMATAKAQALAGALVLLTAFGLGAGWLTYQAVSTAAPILPSTPELPPLPLADDGLADAVNQRVQEWQPTPQERRFDEIGWARSLADARRLAAQHRRPVFLLTSGDSIATGRCPASSFNVRAGALSHDGVIDLLNRAFVPVYLSSRDYAAAGKASPAEKADLENLREEADQRSLSSRLNQAWVLSADGQLLDTLDACHAPADQLLKFLLALLKEQAGEPAANARPVIAPTAQSLRPQAAPDALVLHLTARYLERRDDELLPQRVALGKEVNYFMKGLPGENWIVLDRADWSRLLPPVATDVGQQWDLDADVAAQLFRFMYPPTEDNNVAANRIDEGSLRAVVVARERDVVRARLEGALRMKHRFDPLKDDNRFVTAKLHGYLDFSPARAAITSLRLTTTEASYGKNPIGIAVRSVP